MKSPTVAVLLFWVALFLFTWLKHYFHPASRVGRAYLQIATLMAKGNFRELTEYFERVFAERRLLVRAFDRVWGAGFLELQFAYHLFRIGRVDAAFEQCSKAIAKIDRHPGAALDGPARLLHCRLLSEIGRYDESRAVASRFGVPLPSAAAAAEYYTGRIDEGLAIVRGALERDPQDYVARFFGAFLLQTMGDTRQAVVMLLFDPSKPPGPSVGPHHPWADAHAGIDHMKILEYVELQAGRFLMAAACSIADRNVQESQWALEMAKDLLVTSVDNQHGYWIVRAEISAVEGNRAEMEAHLNRAREMLALQPSRGKEITAALNAAWCYLEVKDPAAAQLALEGARKAALHPIEKHSCAFLTARALEQAGRAAEAADQYRQVVADGFKTSASALAAKFLSGPA